ncbi:chitin-binding protein [Listeria aquatica]|uniref:Chitin-binding protein n=1 Tax=Listeria aquatica TaxID=1494960 RepID=A0A841ZLA1_9LIST|nr:lytic polysaccharide monooxygenase [Listeria aquatica]MBC1521469.1 chitin-binding protein [Listeria aquatica]
MKKNLWKMLLSAFILLFAVAGFASAANAHGYVTKPGSRAYLGSTQFTNDTGLAPLNKNVGAVQYEPQSIEAPKNTFITGKIASAAIDRFSAIDEQTATRWYKTDITTGTLTVNWELTAQHRTSTWDYYMTKSNWDPNAPLNKQDFEKIASIDDGGSLPDKDVEQKINIPSDRKGYNVILAVWNIADTGNAFYQAIDVNVK